MVDVFLALIILLCYIVLPPLGVGLFVDFCHQIFFGGTKLLPVRRRTKQNLRFTVRSLLLACVAIALSLRATMAILESERNTRYGISGEDPVGDVLLAMLVGLPILVVVGAGLAIAIFAVETLRDDTNVAGLLIRLRSANGARGARFEKRHAAPSTNHERSWATR
jgi:hypothetical protein